MTTKTGWRWRVRHGWSAYRDFKSLSAATAYAATIAALPTDDDLCRAVVVLDTHTIEKHGGYAEVASMERLCRPEPGSR